VFPDDDGVVSRLHCEIAYNNALSQFEVRDLGSRNGTFLVGESDKPRRLESDSVQRVAPGEKVLVGSPQNVLVLELC
jgi:pSer/pThr/pTyr-binding forkhead associated (FHA) protein